MNVTGTLLNDSILTLEKHNNKIIPQYSKKKYMYNSLQKLSSCSVIIRKHKFWVSHNYFWYFKIITAKRTKPMIWYEVKQFETNLRVSFYRFYKCSLSSFQSYDLFIFEPNSDSLISGKITLCFGYTITKCL